MNPQWYMEWYFNFDNARGLALHSYTLPGYPASHACVRLLERDAIWIYGWGEGWTLDARGQVVERGTPLLIAGQCCKGMTVYRQGTRSGQVLGPAAAGPAQCPECTTGSATLISQA